MSRRLVLILAIASLLPVIQSAEVPSALSIVEQRIQRIQDRILRQASLLGNAGSSLAERMATDGVPGLSIAVIRNGEIEWARGFGVTRFGGPPVTPETIFQAASLSKPGSAGRTSARGIGQARSR
jgi:CubicO group peptidase (beta-lactamase class C family)